MFQVSVNMTEYKCYSCDAESPDPAVILAHTITHHPDKPLSIRVKCVHHSRVAFRSLQYRHIPRKIEERHQAIWISPNSLKGHTSKSLLCDISCGAWSWTSCLFQMHIHYILVFSPLASSLKGYCMQVVASSWMPRLMVRYHHERQSLYLVLRHH